MSEVAFAPTKGMHPLTGEPRARVNDGPRKQLAEWLSEIKKRRDTRESIDATYDAARDSDDFRRYWAHTDHFDADSANNRAVRSRLVSRSRYEIANNGYSDGIAQTYATDLVGIGPQLRMQTASQPFNQMVEFSWSLWCKAIHFRRKLWTMAHAKHGDGEGLGIARTNRGLNHPVKLDLVLYETEQCQTPMLPFGEPGYIDGIRFDQFGNPIWFDILHQHPGAANVFHQNLIPEQVPAKFVFLWFKMRRPGQHRGVPECASTLNTGAASRRWREAVLASAETAAEYTLFLKTMFAPDELDAIDPMSTMEIQKRMMTALPNSVEPFQLKAEQPNASYEAFHKALINEQARAKNMPYNKAACDSSSYNYASGRLDHSTWYGNLDVDREDCDDLVLDPLFDLWFSEAIRVFGWLGGNPDAIGPGARLHGWDWPAYQVADVSTEADANDTNLKNGSLGLPQLYSKQGSDYEDQLVIDAAAMGVTPEELRHIRLYELHPVGAAAVLSPPPPVDPTQPGDQNAPPLPQDATASAVLLREVRTMQRTLDRFVRRSANAS